MKKVFIIFQIICIMSILSGCKNARDIINDPMSDRALNNWSGVWHVYDTELNTDGDIEYYTTYNYQTLETNFTGTDSYVGKKCIRYSWTGQLEKAYNSTNGQWETAKWCGFHIDNSVARDMSPGGYNRITFYAKGSLSDKTNLEVKGPDSNDKVVITNNDLLPSTWKEFSITITSVASLTNIKEVIKIIMNYTGISQGNGGTVYIDNIEYKKV
ncbi:MAG: hypothetical protein ABH857_00740 [Elusimicrobiota bacterium]